MCGKYYADREYIPKLSLLFKEEEIAADSELRREWESASSDFEGDINPTDPAVVIYASGERLTASKMKWGFRDPYHDTLLINARAETAFDKKMFSDSMKARRCVIPASGYYEWDKARTRYRFRMPEGGLVLLAGCYRLEMGEPRYTILTTKANECMKDVHSRMPVTLGDSEIRDWIIGDDDVSEYLERKPEELIRIQDSGQISMNLGL